MNNVTVKGVLLHCYCILIKTSVMIVECQLNKLGKLLPKKHFITFYE